MNQTQKHTPGYDETTPVLIVGGSLVGLSMSLFLSWHGVPSLLIERHAGVSPHPRAFNFNMRTMELFRMVGAEEAVRQKAPPHFQNSGILRAESLVGRELEWVTQDTTASDLSLVSGCIIGQDVLEPVLRARAEELGSDLRFHTELVSFEQDADGVSAVIRDRTTGVESNVRARYLVAADGGRGTIRQCLGTKIQGPGSFGQRISILFSADMQGPLRGRRVAVCFVHNPEVRKGTSLVFARNGQGFALFTSYYPEKGEQEKDFAGEYGIELVRGAVGIPDLPVEIINVSPWEVAASVAEHFQQGKVFLVGDAAHVIPPAGAFGASTGIADAYNLAWKLGLVLKGVANPDLLLTYTEERQPVGRHTMEQAFFMFKSFSPSPATNKNPPSILPYDATAFGYCYYSATLPAKHGDDEWYEDPTHPTGRPGTHAAHVILERNGELSSTLDLFGRHCVLFAGVEGEIWCDAARRVAEQLGLPLDAYRIGDPGDFADPHGRFLEAYGIRSDGAVLVRPDGFVGWRSEVADTQPEWACEQGLLHMLARSSE
ncbi:MAG: FAD-dependent monooxygenase [Chloroflexota bacterium]|nr:FAD-dependent monooxygenase [Chloroflexota bacterium]